jgi:hypothetical protein
LQALIDSALSDLKDPDFPPECKRTAPNNVRCTKNVPTPNLGSAVRLQLTGLLALDDGISLTGTLAVFPLAPGALEMSPREFKFQPPHFSCSGAGPELIAFFQSSPESFDILQALVLVSYDGTLPCYICGVIPMNDPLGVFPVIAIRWDSPTAASTIRIDPPVPPAAYYAAGANTHYPCDLLVKTTTGTRLIRISPPPVLTQQDIDRLVGQMLVALGNCEKLMDGLFHGHGYNPRWSPRPPGDVDVLHLWEIEVNGLQEGETVTLVDSSQRELVKAMAVDGTSMKLSALLTPASGNELSILRGSKLEGRNVAEPNIPQRESASVPFISFLSVVMSQPRYNSYRTPDILM